MFVWTDACSMLSAQRDTKEGFNCFDLMPNVSHKDEKPFENFVIHVLLWQMCLACAIHTEIKPDFESPKCSDVYNVFVLKLVT